MARRARCITCNGFMHFELPVVSSPAKTRQTGFRLVELPVVSSFARKRRAGFTLVELLVVIAIIGILVALLLPAVQAAREASRRSQCSNNIRQLSTACHTYLSAHNDLPPSENPWYWDNDGQCGYSTCTLSGQEGESICKDGNGTSWIVKLLPHLEQQPLYDRLSQYAFDGRFADGGGLNQMTDPARSIIEEAIATPLATLRCPSDISENRLISDQAGWGDGQLFEGPPQEVTNYKGVVGNSVLGSAFSWAGRSDIADAKNYHGFRECNNGLFWRADYFQKSERFKTITDGTSRTFMLAESLPDFDQHASWSFANGTWGTCAVPPNHLISLAGNETALLTLRAQHQESSGFRSLHPGGLNLCMADGSVHFITEQIDIWAYRKLSTRNGEEIVAEDEF